MTLSPSIAMKPIQPADQVRAIAQDLKNLIVKVDQKTINASKKLEMDVLYCWGPCE